MKLRLFSYDIFALPRNRRASICSTTRKMTAGEILNIDLASQSAIRKGLMWPQPNEQGRYNTLNKMGYMSNKISNTVEKFIQIASQPRSMVLEIGAAYGHVCLRALRNGASGHYIANDIEKQHLEILARKIIEDTPEKKNNVTLLLGSFADENVTRHLESNKFDAILAERVLRFLTEPQIKKAFKQFNRLLKPGGKVFLETATPYNGVTKRQFYESFDKTVTEFLSKMHNISVNNVVDQDVTIPGFIPKRREIIDLNKLSELDMDDIAMTNDHFFVFDQRILKFLLEKEHFNVISCEYQTRDDWKLDGRERLFAIAQKPL